MKIEGYHHRLEAYMGMEIFSGEGLDLNFPPGGGEIFQPRGGQGDLSYRNLPVQMLIFIAKFPKMCFK